MDRPLFSGGGWRIQMKMFFIADLHGSLYYASQAISAYEKEGADRIAILVIF